MFKLDRQTKEYTEAYNKYYATIFNIAYYKTCGNTAEAEDICQEVFIRYFEKFSEVKQPRKWLSGTLRLVLFEHYRKKEKKDCQEISEKIFYPEIDSSTLNPNNNRKVIIKDALENLDSSRGPLGKVIFDLIAVYNYSYQSVANQLGLTKKKVRYRYNKIVRELTDYLNKKGIGCLEELLY